MIRITYAPQDKPLAEQIRDDLSDRYQAAQPVLIVLVSAASIEDPTVQAEIESARRKRLRILPILTEHVALPAPLADRKPLDFSKGYSQASLMLRLTQATMTPGDLRRSNRRALALIGGIAVLIFSVALYAISSGWVAFPVAEYNEEATFQAEWIDGLIRETLEHVQPRTTEDALNFEATYEVAPTRLYFYIRGTATASANSQEE